MKAWIHAARLRTLSLALASVFMGGFLAYADGRFDSFVFILAVITTILLQILSNFANDYGDFTSGVDLNGRVGPERAMQGGHISPVQMKKALIITSVMAFVAGTGLIIAANISVGGRILLFFIGLIAIGAAITYTIGKRPYGYLGLGDLAVFIFFGLIGVLGTHFVIHGEFLLRNILWAVPLGLFSVGVLNLNNIRDLDADRASKKNTIPVLVGRKRAKIYHIILLSTGWLMALGYTLTFYSHWTQLLMLACLPLFIHNITTLWKRKGGRIDPLLKQLALATLLFVLLTGIGLTVAGLN